MSSADNVHGRDCLGYLKRLRQVLQLPALRAFAEGAELTLESEAAAYLLAETIGYCRLYGIEPSGEAFPIVYSAMAAAACRQLHRVLDRAERELEHLPDRWDTARTQLEMDAICHDILRVRMSVWAALVTIDDVAVGLERNHHDETPLYQALDEVVERVRMFDEMLECDVEILSSVVDTNLLENWRGMLADEYLAGPPWWLDGTLERAADRLEREAGNSFPVVEFATEHARPVRSHSFEEFHDIPEAPALAAESQAIRPDRKQLRWASRADGSGRAATLQVPAVRSAGGETKLELQFRPADRKDELPMEEALLGKHVFLGTRRSVIQSRSVADQTILYAMFVLEDILADGAQLGLERCELSVDGQLWYAVGEEGETL